MSENNLEVEYRDIPGFPGYRVGSDGSVWSSRSKFGRSWDGVWRQLVLAHRQDGYAWVQLRPNPASKQIVCYVHRLVLTAFVGPCPVRMEALHGDGNPSNNRLSNLRWGTRSENIADAQRHGVANMGSRSPIAKLTETDIPKIIALRHQGQTFRKIAGTFGVVESAIRKIVARVNWKHVDICKESPCDRR